MLTEMFDIQGQVAMYGADETILPLEYQFDHLHDVER